ncbi:hypothetical protein EYF80_017563 [Liparis tanakae]|uniref:Uncharacterized protein n=1 Tax=Liparis tanakae TaxID=230148 RepID=A0A4Z2I2H4_9TELE|nr:hypothetical protein EYF80_017563 [Liparis tanakae]
MTTVSEVNERSARLKERSRVKSNRILVPNTVMPSVSMEPWSLLRRGLVIFFLQSTMMVTVFFSTLMATRCHLVESTEQRVVLWRWVASLILIQEDRGTSHFHAQLLDSLLVVKGQQEGLEA